ncbi:hypothetical protein AMTRI_Chr05g69120 [Amborella trichopoda]
MAGTVLLHPLEIEPSSIIPKVIESKPEKHVILQKRSFKERIKMGDPSIGTLGENCNFHVHESTEAKTIAISAKTVKKTEPPQGYRSSFMLTMKALASRLSEIHCSKMVKRLVAETDTSVQNIEIDPKRCRIPPDTIPEQNWYEFHTQLANPNHQWPNSLKRRISSPPAFYQCTLSAEHPQDQKLWLYENTFIKNLWTADNSDLKGLPNILVNTLRNHRPENCPSSEIHNYTT